MRRVYGSVFVVLAVLLGMAGTPPAGAQSGGPGDIMVAPRLAVVSPQIRQLKLQRRLEVPTFVTIQGVQAVRYSYGTFLLATKAELVGARGVPPGEQSIPSDAASASKHVADFAWNDFQQTLSIQTTVKNQGARGSCHVQAATGLTEAMYCKAHGKSLDLSEQWLQWMVKKQPNATSETGDGGDCKGDMLKIQAEGHVPELCWRYDPRQWSSIPSQAALDQSAAPNPPWSWRTIAQTEDGNCPNAVTQTIARRGGDPRGIEDFKIKNIVETGNGQAGINAIKAKIDAGIPVAVWVPWPTNAMVADGCILYVPDAVKDKTEDWCWNDLGPDNKSKWFRGGHAIIIVGYGRAGTPAADLFALKNSWGRWWGNDGYGYFTKAFLLKFLWGGATCEINSS